MSVNSTKNDNIYLQDKTIQELYTRIALAENNILNLERKIEGMNDSINKISSKMEANFEKLSNSFNKIVWFGLSTSIGIIITIATNLIK
jgi:hypothetical protein